MGYNRRLEKALQSRWLATAIMAATFVAAIMFFLQPTSSLSIEYNGLLFNPTVRVETFTLLVPIINTAVCAIISILFILMNRQYKLVKSASWFFVGLFFIIALSVPYNFTILTPGIWLALALTVSTLILFDLYGRPKATSGIFLLFFIIATCSVFIAPAIYYIPFFVAGLWSMKILSLRAVIATIMGIITPFWIIWGLELSTPFKIDWPFELIFQGFDTSVFHTSILVSIFTILAFTLVYFFGVAYRTINYNAMRRSCNGFIALLAIGSVALVLFDFVNVLTYLIFICILVAFLISHYYYAREQSGNLVPKLVIPSLFLILIVWNYLAF